jgi:cysteine synthase A
MSAEVKPVARVVESVLELVGDTPLVRLSRVPSLEGASVWAKAEHLGISGSIKDRVCVAMIEEAEKSGALKPGSTIVEATSGNAGASLALVGVARGYRVVLTMPRSMTLERRSLLRALGAQLVLTDPEGGMALAVREAERIAGEQSAWMPRQFESRVGARIHAETTAREILEALSGVPDVLVASVGTGATISGVGRALASRGNVRVVAVEPETSAVLSGRERGPTKIQGIGAGFVPASYDASVVDEVRTVSDRVAWETKQRLAREEGLLVGITAGANVAVACEIARTLPASARVVTFLCDTGERYFSLASFFEEAPS